MVGYLPLLNCGDSILWDVVSDCDSFRIYYGSEFVSKAVDKWAYENKVVLDFSRPGKPIDNAFAESFIGSLRDECLNVNWFLSFEDACAKIAAWRIDYNEF